MEVGPGLELRQSARPIGEVSLYVSLATILYLSLATALQTVEEASNRTLVFNRGIDS